VTLNGAVIEIVTTFELLGVHVSDGRSMFKQSMQKFHQDYFLKQLKHEAMELKTWSAFVVL